MMPDVTEKNTEAAKRSAGTAADATRSTARAAAETVGRGAETAAETARRAAELGRETAMSGLRAMANAQGPLTEAGFEQSRRALEITSRVTDVYRQAAERAADDVHAIFEFLDEPWTRRAAMAASLRRCVAAVTRELSDQAAEHAPEQLTGALR